MNKIKKISSCLLFFINFLIIVLPLSIIVTWYFIDTFNLGIDKVGEFAIGLSHGLQAPVTHVNMNDVQWTVLSESVGISGHILNMLPLFLSLFVLKEIFKNYKNGEIFSTANAVNYKYLSWLFFLDALLAKPLGDALMVMASTLSNPPGQRYISVSFGTPNLEAIFCGAILLVISLVMFEASKLQDESKFVI